MTKTVQRALIDQPTTHRLLTTDEGKMYDLYILETDGTVIPLETLNDDTVYFDWKDHCINPSAFKALAEKYDCQYTEKTFKFIHREFLDNYLNADSVLDVCIKDKLVRVSLNARGIELYCHSLGIDKTFYTIDELNKYLTEMGSPAFYTFERDVKENWQQVVPLVKHNEIPKSYFAKTNSDTTIIETLTVETRENGQYVVNFIAFQCTEAMLLNTLEGYYDEYLVTTTSISELIVFQADKSSVDLSAVAVLFNTKAEVESYLSSKYAIDFSPK